MVTMIKVKVCKGVHGKIFDDGDGEIFAVNR